MAQANASATKMPGAIVVRATNRATGEVRTCTPGHPFAILGRAQHAGVRLDDPSVSQSHAYLLLVDGMPYCIDLGSRTGVLWDDGNQGRGWIHPEQTVRVGIFDVQVTATGVATPQEADHNGHADSSLHAALDIYAPTVPSGCFSLDLPVILVGRHPNCNLRFIDEGVAYFQCALANTKEGPWCVDLLSQRGTVVNGRATRVAPLRDGDLIEFGRVSLVARVGPQTPALAPVRPADVAVARVPGAEAVFEPLRGMMEQFQQSFMTMARMFTTMQQEHTAMMCEQMRQVQEMLREVRETRPLLPPASPPPPAPTPAAPPTGAASVEPKPPVPKPVTPEEGRVLADAHAWFLDRLTQKGPPPGGKPKSD